MSDIGNGIKYLYERFILRDLLSFVTPGTIVVASILLPLLLNKLELSEVLDISKSIPFIFYIPIFGFLFMVGFAVQCFGEVIHLIKIHEFKAKDKAKAKAKDKNKQELCMQLRKVLRSKDQEADDNEHRNQLRKFQLKADEDAKRLHEREVIFKQMCGNGAFAIFIASILFLIKLWKPDYYCYALWVLLVIVVISLHYGHCVRVNNEKRILELPKECLNDK
ncbi:MAG: hypothetical protein ACC630_03060 [Nitrospinota bacterium]